MAIPSVLVTLSFVVGRVMLHTTVSDVVNSREQEGAAIPVAA